MTKTYQTNDDKPLLSIIVPIYNIEAYIERCVLSVLQQSFADYELILVDDGATDGSAEIVDHYAALDPRIVVLHKPNGGLVSARMAGLEVARGTYIHHLDGDDYLSDEAYAPVMAYAKETGGDMVYFRYVTDYDHLDKHILSRPFPKKTYTSVEMIAEVSLQGAYMVWQTIHLRSLYDKTIHFGTDLSIGEDAYLIVQLLAKAQHIVFFATDRPLLHYAVRATSIMQSKQSKEKAARVLCYPQCIDRFLQTTPWYEALAEARACHTLHAFSNVIYVGYLAELDRMSQQAMLLYRQFPALCKAKSTRRYYKLYRMYSTHPWLGRLLVWEYKRKEKILTR